MAKRSLSQQLDQAVEAIKANPEAPVPRANPRVAPLLRIAADLQYLPREDFKARLKADLERNPSMTSAAKAALEKSKVKPIPEGHHTATPYLCIKDAAGAIEFYKKAFGATETTPRNTQPDGRIAYAEIKIGDSPILISDEFPEYGGRGPQSLGGSPVSIVLYVEDVDALARQAVAAGAKVLIPVADQFYGDRSGRLVDPFGHFWIVATHKEDVSPEEIQRRAEAFMRKQGEKQRVDPRASVKPIREGFHTVTPYLIVPGAVELIDFVKQAFGGEELLRGTGSGGGIHAEVRIGDSIVMLGGGGAWRGTPMPAAIHLYVNDADAVYARAVQAGATTLREPEDQIYGDREASVKDPFGNHWYIATHKEGGHVPAGMRTVTPYLHPQGTAKLIDFLNRALGGEETMRAESPEGIIHHAKVRIGDSFVEMGEAHAEFQPMPSAIYLYVEDTDALYKRALQAGATSLFEPAYQPYGDRNAGVADPFGNNWFIATHIKDVSTS